MKKDFEQSVKENIDELDIAVSEEKPEEPEVRVRAEHPEAAVSAILFAMGNSVEDTVMARALDLDTETVRTVLRKMKKRYQEEDRGIQMIEMENSYQLCTKKEYYEVLERQNQHLMILYLEY